ncbi:MAG: transcription-repair coupling factor [Bacteroidota bacterium]
MQTEELITRYVQNGWVGTWAEKLRHAAGQCLHLKGLAGSVDALLAAATHHHIHSTQLFILSDQEEAAYFYTDLQNLLGTEAILLYPAGHNQPYAPVATDRADQLMREEVLHHCNQTKLSPALVVTYPEALPEKVVHQDMRTQHTWTVQVGDTLHTATVTEQLIQQGFDKVGFVYEAGQFALRGGIIDVFGYAYQLPFRLELLGNQVESIRTFDPATQRSVAFAPQAAIVPDLQLEESATSYQSLLDCLPAATPVWIKDEELVQAAMIQQYEAATKAYAEKKAEVGDSSALPLPTVGWETPDSWAEALQRHMTVLFGHRCYRTPDQTFTYEVTAQSAFNQNFTLLAEDLKANTAKGLQNILVAESEGQFDHIATLLEEVGGTVDYTTLRLGLRTGFVDPQVGIACYTDHQLFNRYYRYKAPKRYSKTKAITLRELQGLKTGDYVVHVDYGIGRFAGLSKVTVQEREQEVIRIIYKNDDLVYVSLQSLHKISKYTGKEGAAPSITKLGSSAWAQKKARVKTRVKDIAKELIQLYSKRKETAGFAFSTDGFAQARLETSFIYDDTPDQVAATVAVKKDMEKPHPMDRLICGDVGFGKTEVAIRAAFKAVNDGKQVAVLVPTTILALQHYNSFHARLADHQVKIAYINRFKSTKQINDTLGATAEGKIQVLIGTHRILGSNIRFKDLGLLIIDEEQKFGVAAKDRLKALRVNVDVLTLTATPIPRTLHFSLMGARDLSIIATPPPNRQSVATSIRTFDTTFIKEAIDYELQRGGQVFFVHNRVVDISEIAKVIQKLVPDGRLAIAHGQMDGRQLEQRMLHFIEGKYDILLATSIIESGLDVPNANTIIINNSHLFGLSDLHQMRGRVGRSSRKAFCHLLAPPTSGLTAEARRRLGALEEFSNLGDGFKVAMRDLDIRGAGDLLGAEQSGFIADVGFDTYCRILEDAVQELKEEEFKDLFAEELKEKGQETATQDCIIETDFEALIPETYVNSSTERLSLYTRLDSLKDERTLEQFQQELEDRFGTLPQPVQTLTRLVKLRWLAQQQGFCKLRLKNSAMRCHIASTTQGHLPAVLERALAYVKEYPQRCRIKEVREQLLVVVDQVTNIAEAQEVLVSIAAADASAAPAR